MKKKLFLLFIMTNLNARVIQKESINIKEGNLALRTSQQPAPVFSFGQTTVDKGNIQGFIKPSFLTSSQKFFSTFTPRLIYGFTNELTFLAELPIAAKYKQNNKSASGVGDVLLQLEYVFHEHQTPTYNNLISIVGNITFPSGSFSKSPSTGFGAPSFLLGLAARHRALKWYLWLSPGVNYFFPHNNVHLGSSFLYQAGVGRNIHYVPEKRIITLICEFLGAYTSENKMCGVKDRKSGSNIISIAPVLWVSTLHGVFKAGGLIPLLQQTRNKADKNNYLISIFFGYTFN